ncbi:MAG: cytochrome C biogenesis protein [Pseudomonadota bacterium]|nr:cytochrome C biogenesis protein [Pseudomonadota bacterium]
MTAFVIAAAALALLALAYVARPLLRATPGAGVAVVLTLALLTGGLYLLLGTPAALDAQRLRPPETLADAIVQLEGELERDPAQAEGWRLLGRAYAAADRPAESRDAFARAVALLPQDPDLLAEAAEARAIAAPQRRFDEQAIGMLERAISIQPLHQRARWFLGIALRQGGQPARAAAAWEPLLGVVAPGTTASLRQQIDAARRDAGMEPLPPAVASAAPAPGPPGITVSVSLDPALAMRLPKDGVVFVIARQPGGPLMPVAVERLPASALPTVITLDDSDSLMPTHKLSELDRIEISARISASGDATPAAGDFAATPSVIDAGERVAAVMIDQVIR